MTNPSTNLIGKKAKVLDKGYIELQDMMGDDLAIVNAARVSYLGDSKGEAADKKLLMFLMQHKHTTPFEQVEFKFRIKAPVIVWWQLVRHRTLHLNMQSGRYTPFEHNEMYVPDFWRLQSSDNKQGSDGILDGPNVETLYEAMDHIYTLSQKYYKYALALGVAKEQARLLLPGFSMYYTGIVKVDAHNLMHFLKLRMSSNAQWEIRQYACVLYQEFFEPALPWTAEAFRKYHLDNIITE